MIAYKLFRLKKNGQITSLYINKSKELPINQWIKAECCPTKGFKERPYWHCLEKPLAPHLSLKGRVWYKVEIDDYIELKRPLNQGGTWLLAKNIKLIKEL